MPSCSPLSLMLTNFKGRPKLRYPSYPICEVAKTIYSCTSLISTGPSINASSSPPNSSFTKCYVANIMN